MEDESTENKPQKITNQKKKTAFSFKNLWEKVRTLLPDLKEFILKKVSYYAGEAIFDKYESFGNFGKKSKPFALFIMYLLSPTRWVAVVSTKGVTGSKRRKMLIGRNYFYLTFSIFMLVFLGFIFSPGEIWKDPINPIYVGLALLFGYIIIWSRCNEIFIAFIRDALDKTEGKPSESDLSYRQRIELAFLSYIELISNYAILYYLMPLEWFDEKVGREGYNVMELDVFQTVTNAVYFSGVTITTLGYGDFSPIHSIAQLLVVQQVLIGFTLVIVSFAIYAGKGLVSEQNTNGQ